MFSFNQVEQWPIEIWVVVWICLVTGSSLRLALARREGRGGVCLATPTKPLNPWVCSRQHSFSTPHPQTEPHLPGSLLKPRGTGKVRVRSKADTLKGTHSYEEGPLLSHPLKSSHTPSHGHPQGPFYFLGCHSSLATSLFIQLNTFLVTPVRPRAMTPPSPYRKTALYQLC